MQFAIIIALIVVVVALFWIAVEQGNTIDKYENELLNKKTKR